MSLLARTWHPRRTWAPRPGAGAPASDRTRVPRHLVVRHLVVRHLVVRARMPSLAHGRFLGPADIPDHAESRSGLPVRAG
ncbi:MAG: hypothetical protein ACLPKE_17485, partial [Streptosporangiaceae bacterium]